MDDALDDICPICGDAIFDDDEWTRLPSGELAHVECTEDLKPAHEKTTE